MSIDFEIKDRYDINDLISIITKLRAPDGCPWDMAQTHESLKKHFIEETYEVIDAINNNSVEGMREELGDVLLQIALHCEIESELNNFNFDDICNELCQKLVVRHPHVFGNVVANNEEEALKSWDNAKAESKGIKKQSKSMGSIPLELPALMRAQKVQNKAKKVGFDWDNIDDVFDKVYEEINELKTAIEHNDSANTEEELGDLLFACVNLSRFVKVDSENALTGATNKFIKRFTIVEDLAEQKGISMSDATLEELDLLWDKAKEILAE